MLGFALLSRCAKFSAAAALLIGGAAAMSPAHAAGAPTGNAIIGVFSNPILSGNVLTAPNVLTFQNNGATAVASGAGTSTLTWGTLDGQPQSAANSSSLSFSGAADLLMNAATPVPVGTISFSNGGSSTDTLIFGATLSFYFNTVSASTLLGSDTVYINTTANSFTTSGLSASQLAGDADFVNICGNSSNVCGTSIDSFESAEVNGYQPFRSVLNAVYQGDPSITLTSVVADPASLSDGEIGAQAAFAVPEPTSAALLLAGVVGLGATLRRCRPALR